MKNVLIISATDKIGGAEIVLNDFLEDNSKHNFCLLTSDESKIKDFYNKNLDQKKIFGSKNLKGYHFKKYPFRSLQRLYAAVNEVNCLVKKLNINVLYGNNTKDLFIILFYKKFYNPQIKVISHIHDMLSKRIHKYFFKIFGNTIDLYITPSNACKNILINYGVNSNKVQCVYNGVRLQSYEGIRNKYLSKNDINIYIIGRICELKRIDIFVDTLVSLQQFSNKHFQGYVIGALEDEIYLEKLKILQYSFIKYIGEKSKKELIGNIYPHVDALFLCSDSETLPTVVLEAMSFGKLVFARNVDGVPEIITNNEDGIIFDYAAKPKDIAKIIVDTFDDLTLVNKLSKNAIIKIREKFNEKSKKEKINKLIESI